MKKQLFSLGLITMLLGTGTVAYSQEYIQSKITKDNGSLSLVTFKDTSKISGTRINEIFQDVLKLSPNNEMRFHSAESDAKNKFRDEKFQQFYKGIVVEFSGYYVHYKEGKITSMNGEVFKTDTAIATTPSISESSALQAAINKVGAKSYMWEDAEYMKSSDYKKPVGEIVLLPVEQKDGSYKLSLAYRFDIYAQQPISREYVYVDATNGKVLMNNPIMMHSAKEDGYYKADIARILSTPTAAPKPATSNILLATGTADTRYSGTQSIETILSGSDYILYDTTRGNGVRTYNLKKSSSLSAAVDFKDTDNNWSAAEFDNDQFDNAALDAHWGVEKTYDYFLTKHNRNSYNNLGTLLRSYVHYGSNYENAAWTGSEMIYGDGANSFKPLTAFDVTAHELGHGVCSSTAKLVYQRESGAMNEGFSDIWGASAEATYAPDKQRWLIGEDIVKVTPGYLRSMSNPKSGSPKQPDTYRGINWYPATAAEGCANPNGSTNDNCGVHYNSGVLNHWYYILTEGKSGTNDLGKSYNVTGIGLEKAAKIAYRLETAYLTPNATYMDARNFGIQAAKDLYGADTPEAIATQDAFYAVGLGFRYLAIPDTTAPTIPTNLQAINTTGTHTTLTWNPSTDDNEMDSYLVFKDGTQIATVNASKTTYTVGGLTPKTTYGFFVKAKDAWDNISDKSNTVSVTTLDQKIYCDVTATATDKEVIKRVKFNSIDNTSTSKDGYEDFTYLSTDVYKGQTYEISITPEWSGSAYNEGYAVYIDLNNDGDFSDAGEQVFTKAASPMSPITGNITIPTDATSGQLRMRVAMRYNGVPTACGTIARGQIEDYTLNVGVLGTADVDVKATKIYPNPVKDFINIQSKAQVKYDYTIFNVSGQMVSKGTSSEKTINAQSLSKGVYVIELNYHNGGKITQKFIKD